MESQDIKKAVTCLKCFEFRGTARELASHRRKGCKGVRVHQDTICRFTYFCAYCDKVYDKHKQYVNHLRSEHQDEKLFKNKASSFCSGCGLAISSKAAFRKHQAFHGPFHAGRCCQCDIEISSWQEHSNHLKIAHGGTFVHLCGHCGIDKFEDVNDLKIHRKTCCKSPTHSRAKMITEKGKVKCDFCPIELAPNSLAVRKHILDYHPESIIPCTKCDYKATSKHGLRTHFKAFHEPKQLMCENCDQVFAFQHDLKIHRTRNHVAPEFWPFPCMQCDKKFTHKPSLQHHVDSKHRGIKKAVKREVCDICGCSVTINNYKDHLFTKHGQGQESALSCSKCERKFRIQTKLDLHMANDHVSLPCDICGKMFLKSRMKRHVDEKHTMEHMKAHVCKLCHPTKGFGNKTMFNAHMNIHTGKRPYKCSVCTYSATNAPNIYKHIKNSHKGVTDAFMLKVD